MDNSENNSLEFNKEGFSKLLKKAMGSMTEKTFAEKCGLSASYISIHLNGKGKSKPKLDTIKKIAKVSEKQGVSEIELLRTTGYFVGESLDLKYLEKEQANFKKQAKATIINSLGYKTFNWKVNNGDMSPEIDLCIELYDEDINKWFFIFMKKIDKDRILTPLDKRTALYSFLISNPVDNNSKVSYVTDLAEDYQELLKNPPLAFPAIMSVIQIDTSDMTVIKEEYLGTRINPTDDIINRYSFV